MMTPTRIVRMIGIAGLVGWMGMAGWVAKTTLAQNGGQTPAPLPQTATMPENLPKEGQETPKVQSNDAPAPLPVAPDSGASLASEKSPPPPLPVSPPQLEPAESPSAPPVPRRLPALTENQPASSTDDPEQSAQSFVERNQKEAEDHLRALTAEAQQLRARLAKLESGIKKWQGLVSALKSSQGQSIASTATATAPGAEDAGDLEPIKPSQSQAGGARADKRVKWATATSAATGAGAQPAPAADPPQQLPAAQPLQVVAPGSVPR